MYLYGLWTSLEKIEWICKNYNEDFFFIMTNDVVVVASGGDVMKWKRK
jgi:hypothetical protein